MAFSPNFLLKSHGGAIGLPAQQHRPSAVSGIISLQADPSSRPHLDKPDRPAGNIIIEDRARELAAEDAGAVDVGAVSCRHRVGQ